MILSLINQYIYFVRYLSKNKNIYKNQEDWETCLGLLKVRKRISLTNLIESESLKGNSKKWAIKVENLHTYVPNVLRIEKLNEPMWE